MDIEVIEAQLADYRRGLEGLQQQVLVQQGAILALEQLLAKAQENADAKAQAEAQKEETAQPV